MSIPPESNSRAASAITDIASLHSCQRDVGLPRLIDVESSTWCTLSEQAEAAVQEGQYLQ